MIEDAGCFHHGAAAECVFTMVETGRHHHHILPQRIGSPEDVVQVVEIPRIADSHQNIPRTNPKRPAAQFLVPVHPELIQILRFAVARFGHLMFRISENGEKHCAERDSSDRGFGLGEQIHAGGGEQYGGDDDQSSRHFLAEHVEWAGDEAAAGSYPVKITVFCDDRFGMLKQITSVIRDTKTNIRNVDARTSNGQGTIDVILDIVDLKHLENIITGVRKIPGVHDVQRLQKV